MGSGLVHVRVALVLYGVRGSGECVGIDFGVEQNLEGSGGVDAHIPVFIDVNLREERLVAQATVRVVAPGVDVCMVLQ